MRYRSWCCLAVGFAAPLLAVIDFSFMPERTFGLFQTPTLRELSNHLPVDELHFLPVVAQPGGSDDGDPGADLLSGSLLPGSPGGTVGDGADAALHHPAVCVGECPPLWLGAVPYQERRAPRHVEIAVRHRGLEHVVHVAGDHSRHGLCLSAFHAVPNDARHRHGAERNARGGL